MKANSKFVNGDEAVSPVIAVILMVAITVVLAATVYLFVSGFGSNQNSVVSASFAAKSVDVPGGDTDTTDDAIELTYTSGTSDLAATDVELFIDGNSLTMAPSTPPVATDQFLDAGTTWCSTAAPGGSATGQWARGHSVFIVAGDATSCGIDPGPPTATYDDATGVHQVKVIVRGQVVLDTSIQVHDAGDV